jgi:hypothetical protein
MRMWTYLPEFGALEQEFDPDGDGGEADALLRPERLLPSIEIEVVGPPSPARRRAPACEAPTGSAPPARARREPSGAGACFYGVPFTPMMM